METFTQEQAEKLIMYYNPIIIGNKVHSQLAESYKVMTIVFELTNKNKGVIYCIAPYNSDIFKRNLINYVNDFKLTLPSEILETPL